jgi:hypothetical protein
MVEWLSSRTLSTTNAGMDVGKKEPSYTAGGNVSQYIYFGKHYGGSFKTKHISAI